MPRGGASSRAARGALALLALLLAGCGGRSGSSGGAVFWAQSPHGSPGELGSIGRAALGGARADGRFIVGARAPAGVAVSGGYIYWSSYAEHAIGRADLDGTGVTQRCIDTQTRPLETIAEGLAADEEHVYWTTYPADTIAKANLDGPDSDEHLAVKEGMHGSISCLPGRLVSAGRLRAVRGWLHECTGARSDGDAPLLLPGQSPNGPLFGLPSAIARATAHSRGRLADYL